jgi:nitroimidazol reductase NimA-like FMN-containing flavoprotein (pyridoxamine 5'-phosphate oxidase superfamily)
MNAPTQSTLAENEQEVVKLLQEQPILVLGTISLDGGPMVHGMHYVSDGTTVYVSSLRATRKLLDVRAEPRVAYAIWKIAGYEDRHAARSLQMQAVAEVLTDEADIRDATARMVAKEPWFQGTPMMRFNRWLRLRPQQALWQQGAEEIDARRILRFSQLGNVVEAQLYPQYLKEVYATMAASPAID